MRADRPPLRPTADALPQRRFDDARLARGSQQLCRHRSPGRRARERPPDAPAIEEATMDDQLYREYILEHYKHPHNHGSLEHADMEAHDLNPLCGDELTFQVALGEDGKVSEVAFDGHGCAISQASASMLSDEIKGMTTQQLLALDHQTVLD